MNADRLLTTQDAALILKKSPETIRLYHRQGKLTALLTIKGQRLFSESEVAALAATQSQQMPSDAMSK